MHIVFLKHMTTMCGGQLCAENYVLTTMCCCCLNVSGLACEVSCEILCEEKCDTKKMGIPINIYNN